MITPAHLSFHFGEHTHYCQRFLEYCDHIRKAEEMKQMFKKIRFLCKDKSQGGLNRIEVPVDEEDDPKTCTKWRAVDIPDEILDLLRKRNQKHFGQAQVTPFMIPPCLNTLTSPHRSHLLK